MGIRQRKNHLITVLKVRKLAHRMTDEQFQRFELMYRRAKTEAEQDQVTEALRVFTDGWKEGTDTFSRLLRDVNDIGESPFGEDEDEDPPALREALARSRVTFSR